MADKTQQPAPHTTWLPDEVLDALSSYIFKELGSPSDWCGFNYDGARALLSQAAPMGPVVAWVRFCSDGGVEGPIMDWDRRMDDARRKSGAWTPLGVIAAPQPRAQLATATRVVEAIRRLFTDGQFDLRDSPKSFMAAVVRLIEGYEAASGPRAEQLTSLHAESVKEDAESLQRGGEAQLAHAPTDAQIAETAQRIARLLLGDVRKVDCDIIESHFRALLAAPAAAEVQSLPSWCLTGSTMKTLGQELIRAAEASGGDDDELILELRRPGTVEDDNRKLNERHILAVSLAEYPEEGVYPIDPADPTGGRVGDPQAAHSRQAQGGALSDQDIDALVDIDRIAGDYGTAEWRRNYARAILARAASDPRAEGLDDSAIEALRLAESALSECYDVTAWPADGKSECDKALVAVRAALAAQKKGA